MPGQLTAGDPDGEAPETAERQGPQVRLPDHLAHRVPAQLWDGLSDAQRRMLISTLAAARTRHAIDYRVSFDTIVWGPWYFTIFAGRERRNRARLAAEGQTDFSRQGGFLIGMALLVVSFAMFGALAFAYLLKSAVGIDFSDDASLFHPLYEWFFGR